VEDQQPHSGDLTTDPAATPEAPAPRGRHRMPRGKQRRPLDVDHEAEAPEADETSADAPPTAAEAASSVIEDVEPEVQAAKPRRRWNPFGRKKEAPSEEQVATPTAEQVDETPEVETAAPDVEVPADSESADTEAATAETDVATAETDGAAAESEDVEPEPVLVPHRPAGKRLKIAAAAAAVLFVAGGAFIGATAQPVIANRALVETKLDIARTAADAITTLWSYTPDNMDSLGDRSARFLTGDFAFQYRKFIDSIVATNKQAQVTNTTSVLGTAVEAASPTEASAIVYTNSIATSPVSKNIPSLRYLSYRLEMKRDHRDWRITRMTTITTLDLTPQL
jgi:Mce-associated membrane protein